MHGYSRDTLKLDEALAPFVNGQCKIIVHHAREMYRGAVKGIHVASDRNVTIRFHWLGTVGYLEDEFDKDVIWRRVPPSRSGELSVTFQYIYYYFQTKERRIKLQAYKEWCRFYLPGDSSNILEPTE